MSLLTVAHQRGSGEFTGYTVKQEGDDHEGGGSDDGGNSNASQSLDFNQIGSGYNGDRELSEMVSALTHVASSGSNQMMSSNEWIQRSGFPLISNFGNASSSSSSSSSFVLNSGSWSGQKRGRDEESSGSSNQYITQAVVPPRLFRTVMVPSQESSSSPSLSSGALSISYFFLIPSSTSTSAVWCHGYENTVRFYLLKSNDYHSYNTILQS
jgi:hypothetical protein